MIPISLRLKGIYSYQAEQLIDFSRLVENGLFGIFGAVGSGKSTILEAISYAIYGETERLNSRENRSYNMMNLKSDELLIDFECKAGKGNADSYRFVVRGKRGKKRHEDVKSFDRQAYKLENGEWIPTAESAEEIIGLSYVNFQRTIIIPQGKFSEFLHLGGADRTSALMEIFQLDRFDLDGKAKKLHEKITHELTELKALAGQYETIDEEGLAAKESELKKLLEDEKALAQQLKDLMQAEQGYKRLQELARKLQELQQSLGQYELRKEKITSREADLVKYRSALAFADLLQARERQQLSLERQISEKAAKEAALEKSSISLKTQQENFALLKEKYLQRDSLKLQAQQLNNLASYKLLEEKKEEIKKRINNGTAIMVSVEEAITANKAAKEKLKERLAELKKAMPDAIVLGQLLSWFDKRKVIDLRVQELQKDIEEAEKQLSDLAVKPKAILAKKQLREVLVQADGREANDILGLLSEQRSQIEKEIDASDAERRQAELESRLAELSLNLNPGDPCPLCGAKEHPKFEHQHKSANEPGQLKAILEKQQYLKVTHTAIQEAVLEIDALKQLKEDKVSSKKSLQDTLKARLTDRETHDKAWPSERYTPAQEEEIYTAIRSQQALQKELADIESALTTVEAGLEADIQKKDKYELGLQELKNHINNLNGQQSSFESAADKALWIQHENETPDALKAYAAAKEREYAQIEKDYQAADNAIRVLENEVTGLKTALDHIGQAIAASQKELAETISSLQARLANSPFQALDEITSVLGKNVNVEAEQAEIDSYYREIHVLQAAIVDYKKQIAENTYDADAHKDMLQQIQEKQEQSNELQKNIGALKHFIEKQKADLEQKAVLFKKLEQAEAKEQNIQTLRNLFKGKGFVDYVSSIYLQSLCQAANERFRKLTRQSLRLELGDNNQFQVLDLLNGGKIRHIKTLSGGQTFQAALSLALALADNIQQLAHSQQNFFFLDEGFGSLDKESLQTVMDTLKSLHKENRVVGVISHVEELQQEVDVHLRITNAHDGGSVIGYSWE
jgi:exonuclease SbcC